MNEIDKTNLTDQTKSKLNEINNIFIKRLTKEKNEVKN